MCREGAKNALDNLYNSAGFVGVGIGDLLHRRWADSHPVGGCFGSNGNPAASGAQSHLIRGDTSNANQPGDWAADCFLKAQESKKHAPDKHRHRAGRGRRRAVANQ
jgi:hypothetical protein